MELYNPYFYAANINLLAYENAWIRYIESGEKNTNVLDEEIYDSWDRCRKYQINPFSTEVLPSVSDADLKRRIDQNASVMESVKPFMQIIYEIIDENEFVVALSDSEGIVLDVMYSHQMESICMKLNFFPGADRREHVIGTDSINMAIRLNKPIQLTGHQHYKQKLQQYTSSSSPVCSVDGDILCVLTILGKYALSNEHSLGMVYSISRAIEYQYRINKINCVLKTKNDQLKTILSMINDSIIYVEDEKIIEINNAMLTLLGRKKGNVIGKNIYEIINTHPPIAEIIAENNKENSKYVHLVGKNDSYKCIVTKEHVNIDSKDSQIGIVLKFVQIKSLEQMASKLQFAAKYSFDDLVGESANFLEAISIAKKASGFDSRVIISGESGTGKEMFAQAIHNGSNRKIGPFVAVDCGAIPHELFESEFFGYEKGAFTGANKDGKIGFVEKADNGTLFLDEIGNLPLDMQVKLLRVLQEGTVFRVGGTVPIEVDIRVIVATNSNLEELIDKGEFRNDLYYRLNVFRVNIPPLRERSSDIPMLANYFLKRANQINVNLKFTKEALDILTCYHWPGNVRQLQNVVERASIVAEGNLIKPKDVPEEISCNGRKVQRENEGQFFGENSTLKSVISGFINYKLEKNGMNVTKTAKELGVSRTTIYKYLPK